MYCKNCGNKIDEDAKFCPSCGTSVDEPIKSEQQNNQYQSYQGSQTKEEDAPNLGFAILGAVIPLAGLILYFMWKDSYPLKAGSCIKGFFVSIALEIALVCCLVSSAESIARKSYYRYDIVQIIE